MLKRSVLICNICYNNAEQVFSAQERLRSLLKSEGNWDFLIVDNGSDVSFQSPNETIILRLIENVGFGGACNAALEFARESNYPALIFNSNDLVYSPNIETYILGLESNQSVTFFSTWHNDINRENFGIIDAKSICGLEARSRYFNMNFWVAPRTFIESDTRFSEEKYVVYWEDIELSQDIMNKKFDIREVNDRVIFHLPGSGSSITDDYRIFHYYRGSAIYALSNNVPITIAIWNFFGCLKFAVFCFLKAKFKLSACAIKGLVDGVFTYRNSHRRV